MKFTSVYADPQLETAIIDHLSAYLTQNRIATIQTVLDQRTRRITAVLEDFYQPQNANAVLRTCEGLGIQDVHVIENRHFFRVQKGVVKGSAKWLDLHRYKPGTAPVHRCVRTLKKAGYKIYATAPDAKSFTPYDLPLDQKIAVVFGNEKEGVSREMLEAADGTLTLPMVGFTQSYNVSVAVGIALETLLHRLRSSDLPWGLDPEEKRLLTLEWYRKSLDKWSLLERDYLEKTGRIRTGSR